MSCAGCTDCGAARQIREAMASMQAQRGLALRGALGAEQLYRHGPLGWSDYTDGTSAGRHEQAPPGTAFLEVAETPDALTPAGMGISYPDSPGLLIPVQPGDVLPVPEHGRFRVETASDADGGQSGVDGSVRLIFWPTVLGEARAASAAAARVGALERRTLAQLVTMAAANAAAVVLANADRLATVIAETTVTLTSAGTPAAYGVALATALDLTAYERVFVQLYGKTAGVVGTWTAGYLYWGITGPQGSIGSAGARTGTAQTPAANVGWSVDIGAPAAGSDASQSWSKAAIVERPDSADGWNLGFSASTSTTGAASVQLQLKIRGIRRQGG